MYTSLFDNLRFLVDQTLNQLHQADSLLEEFSEKKIDKVTSNEDYIDNLKVTIENECFSVIHNRSLSRRDIDKIRSINVIGTNVERIADYVVNIADQTRYLINFSFLRQFDHKVFVEKIEGALTEVIEVLKADDLSKALDICKVEYELDLVYKTYFDRLMEMFQTAEHHEDLITAIFIFRYFERIGDSILNIGEALIFAILGDRIKIRHFEALEQNIANPEFGGDISQITADPILGSRSGCRISKVKKDEGPDSKEQGIFKEGSKEKIHSEYENILKWRNVSENLPPKVYGYLEKDDKASMLVECLPGRTFDQVLIDEDSRTFDHALKLFIETVFSSWTSTISNNPRSAGYAAQLESRLDSVENIHPYFFRDEMEIGGKIIHSTRNLVKKMVEKEADLQPPFSVLIHGDFNLNNVIYNDFEDRMHYIDLYRSRMLDWIQDASVCLVSAFRIPVFKGYIRERINFFIHTMYRRFTRFARENGDNNFEARLAFALARSFFTSTRFTYNKKFAKEMFNRSEYIMDKLASYEGDWENFRITDSVLFY
mgnify:FL=1